MPDTTITELTEIDPERVDGVRTPANGFPFLMIKAVDESAAKDVGCGCCDSCRSIESIDEEVGKAVNGQGGIDEKPDIAMAEHVLVELFKLIGAEAAEGATGAFHELYDIQCLVEAVCLMRAFLDCEQMGDEDDGEPIAKALGYVVKRKFSAQRRRELAGEGHALSDGSYPIENAEDLHNAAVLARSGHGDVAAAKRLIAKRAKELGVANPLAHDTAKDTDPEKTDQDESIIGDKTPADEAVKGDDVDARIQEAVAKAMESQEEVIKGLRDELAKVKATPIPGGPVVTAPAAARKESERSALLAKAAHFERMADQIPEQDMKAHYRAEAAAARTAANA